MRRSGRVGRRRASTVSFAGPVDDAGVPELIHVDVHEGGRGHTHLDLRYLIDGGDADPDPPEGESQQIDWFSWDAAIDRADPGLRGILLVPAAASPHPEICADHCAERTICWAFFGWDAVGLRGGEHVFDTGWMGFNNPSWSWSELEATLSGKAGRDGRAPGESVVELRR